MLTTEKKSQKVIQSLSIHLIWLGASSCSTSSLWRQVFSCFYFQVPTLIFYFIFIGMMLFDIMNTNSASIKECVQVSRKRDSIRQARMLWSTTLQQQQSPCYYWTAWAAEGDGTLVSWVPSWRMTARKFQVALGGQDCLGQVLWRGRWGLEAGWVAWLAGWEGWLVTIDRKASQSCTMVLAYCYGHQWSECLIGVKNTFCSW